MASKRRRKRQYNFDNDEIYHRIEQFVSNVEAARGCQGGVYERMEDRYAMYRQWVAMRDDDLSNFAPPDVAFHSQKIQDSLVNSTTSTRPAIEAVSMRQAMKDMGKDISELLDYQFFEEAMGEMVLGDISEDFSVGGFYQVFVPWAKEKRSVPSVEVFDPMPEDIEPSDYFSAIMAAKVPQDSTEFEALDPSTTGWDWTSPGKKYSFYTDEEDKVELVTTEEVVAKDSPAPRSIDFKNCLYPPRSTNLQIPSSSNPYGAPYVILIERTVV
ncbi:MAG: hypothetical protein HKM94_03790, partial [Halobacteria archaeon]|nr:hypothetical protein [Halobacteria archaeon]